MSTATVTQLGHGEPKAEPVLVTPEMAAHWLKTANTRNRALRPRGVSDMARDMAAGKFAMNGEAIKFGWDGNLLDGQHRLAAVVEAGVAVLMLVITGLDPATQETMDSGRRRNAGDALTLRGEHHTQALAAILRKVWQWERGDTRFNGRAVPTTAECTALLGERPELRRSAEISVRIYKQFRYIPQSILGTAHYVFSGISTESAVWYFARVGDGAELPTGHPVLTLRNRVIADKGASRRIDAAQHMEYLVRTWNAYRDGRDLERIVVTPGGQMPLPH